MDLIPATASNASGQCIVRGQRLARVKFVSLPMEPVRQISPIRKFISRVIGRLVAARP
jgi:hypothetical protein